MTDKELAEKVARYLGWVKGTYEKGSQILNWETSGMMIEKMEKEGWGISIDLGFMCFLKKLPNGEMSYSEKTKEQCVNNNWHKAIAMAFIEAMEMIND